MSIITVQQTSWLNQFNRQRALPPIWADDTARETTPELPTTLDVDAIFAEITALIEPPSILDADADHYGRHAYVEPELAALEELAEAQSANLAALGQINLRRPEILDAVQTAPETWEAATGQLAAVADPMDETMTWGERLHDRIEARVKAWFRR